jgi:SAM-dependent methyltransferase
VVVSFETVEHVPEPRAFLHECHRVMAPGGVLIMSTPNKPVYQHIWPGNEFHCSEMTEEEFAHLLGGTFGSCEMYGQCIEWIAWRSPRVLVANKSTWTRLPGGKFARKVIMETFCPHLAGAAFGAIQNDPVGAITKRTNWADALFNPYLVRPRKPAEREVPIYLVGVARKADTPARFP